MHQLRLALALTVAAGVVRPAVAAEFAPTTVTELVQAIEASNVAADPDVITLPGGTTFTLTEPYGGGGSIVGLPLVVGSLTMRSQGPGRAVIERAGDASAFFRLLEVTGTTGNLVLEDVVLRGGAVPEEGGGCVLSSADESLLDTPTLALRRVRVEQCFAARGGGVAADHDTDATQPSGFVQIEDSEITGNTATIGGGIGVRGGGLVLLRSRVAGNLATGFRTDGVAGGGIATIGVPDGDDSLLFRVEDSAVVDNSVLVGLELADDRAFGGGIANEVGADMVIRRSTISRNRVEGTDRVVGGGLAGGLGNGLGGEVLLENVTVSDNVVQLLDDEHAIGGGIGDLDGTSWYLYGCTVVRNAARKPASGGSPSAQADGGGMGFGDGSTPSIELSASILASNEASSIQTADCYWTTAGVESNGYNVVGGPATCAVFPADPFGTDVSGEDPLVGPLAENGGPTPTVALLPGSPAIDWLPADVCATLLDTQILVEEVALDRDQRGIPRPQGAACDVGAFEVEVVPGATTTTTVTTTTVPGATTTSTTPGGGVTTTTSLPGCPDAATFAAVSCRLADLLADVTAATDLGKVRKPLLGAVNAARVKASQAAEVVGQKPPKASKALKAARKRLAAGARKLRGKAGRKVPEATRTDLLRQLDGLVRDLGTLAAAPAA